MSGKPTQHLPPLKVRVRFVTADERRTRLLKEGLAMVRGWGREARRYQVTPQTPELEDLPCT